MADALALCDFLSRLFAAPPDADFVRSCRDGAGSRLLAELAAEEALCPGVELMSAAIAAPEDERSVSERIGQAYTLLFTGVAGPNTVSPYASVHLCGRLFGEATGRMDQILTTLGLVVVTDYREPADHLAIQLAVLAELLRRDDLAGAFQFCDQHLGNWVPAFRDLCLTRDPSGFYAGAAMVLAAGVSSGRTSLSYVKAA
jgi:TorA-specific chaperone